MLLLFIYFNQWIPAFLSDEFYVTGPLQILVEKKKKTPKRDSVSVSKLVDF